MGVKYDAQRGGNFNDNYVNITSAADLTFGTVNQSIQALQMVAVVYILALAFEIILVNFFMRVHPLWFFAHLLLSLLAIIFSVPISNAYENLLNS